MSKPHVLIAISTYEGHAHCREEWIKNTVALAGSEHDIIVLWNGGGNPSKYFPKNWKIRHISERADELPIHHLGRKHRWLRQYFLKRKKYTHFFMLESDNFPPPKTIEKFLEYDKPVISAVYFINAETSFTAHIPNPIDDPARRKRLSERYGAEHLGKSMYIVRRDYIPSVWGIQGEEGRLWKIHDLLPQRGLVKVLGAGVGSVLIRREVFDNIDFRTYDEKSDTRQFTDFNFYWDCNRQGIPVYVDTDTIIGHIHEEDEISGKDKWFSLSERKFTRLTQIGDKDA